MSQKVHKNEVWKNSDFHTSLIFNSLVDTMLTFIEATMLHWPDTKVVIKNIAHDDKNDVITEIFRSRAVLVGSPTINNGHSFAIAGLLEDILLGAIIIIAAKIAVI